MEVPTCWLRSTHDLINHVFFDTATQHVGLSKSNGEVVSAGGSGWQKKSDNRNTVALLV
jgi:hypothetical protein